MGQSPFEQKNRQQDAVKVDNIEASIKKAAQHNKLSAQKYPTLPPLQKSQIAPVNVGNVVDEKANKQTLTVHRDNTTGMPFFIEGFQHPNPALLQTKSQKSIAAMDFLGKIQEQICIEDGKAEFTEKSRSTNTTKKGAVEHIKMQQNYQGVPVYGAELIVHLYEDGKMTVNGRNQPTPYIEQMEPSIYTEEAIGIAITDVNEKTVYVDMGQKEKDMLKYEQPQSELVILPSRTDFGSFNLAYHLTVRPNFVERYEYFIDAHTGEILNHYNHTCSLDGAATASVVDLNGINRTINTYQYQGDYYLYDASRNMYSGPDGGLPQPGDGGVETLNFGGNAFNNPAYEDVTSANNNWEWSQNNNVEYALGVTAHYNSGEAYEYFRNTHGHNSINGQKGDILSFVNVADQGGGGLDNAFWNGQYMFYGNGKSAFYPLAGALDVAGHEMCHGVIQTTANLEYQGESGAINESMADVFGVMIDRDDWQLGEDVVRPEAFPSGALRDMQDPHNGGTQPGDGWQPSHYNERYTGSQDNGGVHINSGITNKAFYNIATTIGSNAEQGKQIAERVYFRALTDYLTRSSQFVDLRMAVLNAANDEGLSENQKNIIRNGFGDVGIGEGSSAPVDVEIDENDGAEFIMSLDLNPEDATQLYESNTQPSDYNGVSATKVNRKPSISDNGCHLFFVSKTDYNIHYINRCTNDGEQIIEIPGSPHNGNWENVAISKDGKRLAMVSRDIDRTIYVYNVDNNAYKAFELYNPTYTQENIQTQTVQYADVLEWDYTSENIIYDSYNVIDGVAGAEDRDFWDVNIIEVWDNNNGFTDGRVSQIFSNLPEGVSIGNPSFSKNSPVIFAIDYWDQNDDVINLLGVNLETGDIGTIREDIPKLAFPSYSVDDNEMIFDYIKGANDTTIAKINISNDKISSGGGFVDEFIPIAKWGLWFAKGNRVLPTSIDEIDENRINFSIAPNPFEQAFEIHIEDNEKVGIQIYNLNGQLMQELPLTNRQGKVTINANDWLPGAYLVKINGENWTESRKVLKIQ